MRVATLCRHRGEATNATLFGTSDWRYEGRWWGQQVGRRNLAKMSRKPTKLNDPGNEDF